MSRCGVGVSVGVRVGSCVGSVVGAVVGPSVCGAVGVLPGAGVVPASVVAARVGAVLADSPPPNGLNSTKAISASGIAAIAPTLILLVPPNRPSGPRTALPFSSTQNAQPSGAGGHDSVAANVSVVATAPSADRANQAVH